MLEKGFTRRSAGLFVALLAVAGVAAPSASAGAGKSYRAVLAPQQVPAGATSTTTARITNLSAPQGVGSANVTAPAGWIVSAAAITEGTGTVSVVGQVVQLRDIALAPKDSVTVSMTTQVPCGTGDGVYAVEARQANDFNGSGNVVALNEATSDLTVGRSGACSLRFVLQPPAEVGNAQPFSTSVERLGGDGTRSTVPGVVSLTAAAGSTLGGPAEAATSGGLATFDGVSLSAPDGTATTLTATSTGFEPATSKQIVVHGDYVECEANQTCSAFDTFSYVYGLAPRKATFELSALEGPDASALVIDQFLVGNPETADEGCSGDDLPQPVIARFLGANRRLQFVQTVDRSLVRSPSLTTDVFYGGVLRPCLTLPYEFSGSTPAGEIDGKPAWRGLVKSCRFLGIVPFTSGPCTVSQGTTMDGDYSMTVALPASELDPYSR